jgi:hypothetical protein
MLIEIKTILVVNEGRQVTGFFTWSGESRHDLYTKFYQTVERLIASVPLKGVIIDGSEDKAG